MGVIAAVLRRIERQTVGEPIYERLPHGCCVVNGGGRAGGGQL
jgi:hypothetical protein